MYAALIAFILGLLMRPKSHNQEHSQNDSSTTTDKQTDNPAIIPARVQVSFSEESEKERRAYQEQYYALQKSLKRAAWLTFWGVFIYAGITLAVWHATQKAASTAEKQLEMSERPWIKIVNVEPTGNFPAVGGLSFLKAIPNSDGINASATLNFKVSFTNIGHSVADVSPRAELFMPPFSNTEYWNRVAAEEKRFCDSPDVQKLVSDKITLFPDEPQPFDYRAGLTAPIRPEGMNRLAEGSGIFPALIVCVSYRQKGLPNAYQTRAVYEISHVDTHSRLFDVGACNIKPFSDAPNFTFCEGGVPAKLLKFDRNQMGDDAY